MQIKGLIQRWPNLAVIIKTYLTVLAIFTGFRLFLFLTELRRIESFSGELGDIIRAFIMGVRFDVVISGYILALPALVLSVLFILNRHPEWIYKLFFWWVFILFTIAFIVCAVDVPYFNQFFSRLTVAAFQWTDNMGMVMKMLLEEPRYYIILIPLIIFIYLFIRILKRIYNKIPEQRSDVHVLLRITVSLVLLGMVFIGIRGRIQAKAPIKVGTAYFSDNAFLNQLGLNPVFTFMRSYLDVRDQRNRSVTLMEPAKAIEKVREYLGISEPIGDYPVARQVLADSSEKKEYNVVLVLMESMSAANMARHGNKENLTPFLDSISHQGYYFENIYSAGIHTFNGVFSTLFSFPAIYRQNPMRESTIFKYNGIGYTLRKNGYSTVYFTTHDGQFDNIEGFLKGNDFEYIFTQDDYPAAKVKTSLGVPDDYMFEFSMPVIDGLYEMNKPFFITFLTASNHTPYYLPGYYQPRHKDIKDQMVEYADWSLRKFVEMAASKPWFEKTVFVFIADHGLPINARYDIPLDYHHSPLIFYAPGIIRPETFSVTGGQIDVFPTIMGILNQNYINNTLGIDLIKESRPYIFINHEDKLGVLDDEFLLIMKPEGERLLYKYKTGDKKNYSNEYPDQVRSMEEYTNANLQVFQDLMGSDKRFCEYKQ
ncbi:MAG: sulfatase-like hydrolase/transferase [Bacteroidales bacterium]|nr:sulfatase-like hydrolase/transferase [Bacteroidales bacterium]